MVTYPTAYHSSQKSRNLENNGRCVDVHSSSKYRTMINSPAELGLGGCRVSVIATVSWVKAWTQNYFRGHTPRQMRHS